MTKYRIPRDRVTVTTESLAAAGIATVVVRSGSAPPDIYAGTLFTSDSKKVKKGPKKKEFLVAITELGIPLT